MRAATLHGLGARRPCGGGPSSLTCARCLAAAGLLLVCRCGALCGLRCARWASGRPCLLAWLLRPLVASGGLLLACDCTARGWAPCGCMVLAVVEHARGSHGLRAVDLMPAWLLGSLRPLGSSGPRACWALASAGLLACLPTYLRRAAGRSGRAWRSWLSWLRLVGVAAGLGWLVVERLHKVGGCFHPRRCGLLSLTVLRLLLLVRRLLLVPALSCVTALRSGGGCSSCGCWAPRAPRAVLPLPCRCRWGAGGWARCRVACRGGGVGVGGRGLFGSISWRS